MKNDNFEQSHSAEKSERGTLWDFQTSIMFQNIRKNEEGPFGTIRNFSKKRLMVPKKIQVKNTQIAKVGILSRYQVVIKVLDVGLIILDEALRFAVCFRQTEQMNKKVDLTRVKKNYPL